MTHKKRSALAALFCAGLMLAASLVAASPAGATTSGASSRMVVDNCAPLNTANDKWLEAVYEYVLGRCVDPSGLAGWSAAMAQGTSRFKVVQAIDFSAEAKGDDVGWAYQYWLDRDPNTSEIGYWSQFITIANGGDDVLWAGVSASDESYAYNLSHDENDTVQADGDWMDDVYEFFLNRDVDESAYDFWLSYIENGAPIEETDHRLSTYSARNAMVRSLLVSDEQARYYVNDVYSSILDRGADSGGAAFWFSWFQKTHDTFGLYENFLSSAEFFNDAQNVEVTARRAEAHGHIGSRVSQSKGTAARKAS
jgi:hypothetical protein